MSSTTMIIIVVIAALELAVIAFLIFAGSATRGRSGDVAGASSHGRPLTGFLIIMHRLFDVGFVRKVDEAISGQTANGVLFGVFECAVR